LRVGFNKPKPVELTKAEAAKGARSTNPDATDLVMRGWGLLGLTELRVNPDPNCFSIE
jgi:hypothetical protein